MVEIFVLASICLRRFGGLHGRTAMSLQPPSSRFLWRRLQPVGVGSSTIDLSWNEPPQAEACATLSSPSQKEMAIDGRFARRDATGKMPPPVLDLRRRKRFYLQIYLEKLVMAANSVGKTSNTVTSLVTCRIS